jgi:hypothetical protein
MIPNLNELTTMTEGRDRPVGLVNGGIPLIPNLSELITTTEGRGRLVGHFQTVQPYFIDRKRRKKNKCQLWKRKEMAAMKP